MASVLSGEPAATNGVIIDGVDTQAVFYKGMFITRLALINLAFSWVCDDWKKVSYRRNLQFMSMIECNLIITQTRLSSKTPVERANTKPIETSESMVEAVDKLLLGCGNIRDAVIRIRSLWD